MKANGGWPVDRKCAAAGFERGECEHKSDGAHKHGGRQQSSLVNF